VVGYEGLREVLAEITHQALASALLRMADIAGAGFGVAGYDWPSERAATMAAIATLGLSCPLEAVNDTLIGPSAASCMSCHRSADPAIEAGLQNHANTNGWAPAVFPDGRQTLLDAAN
jgi:hypothetical protein